MVPLILCRLCNKVKSLFKIIIEVKLRSECWNSFGSVIHKIVLWNNFDVTWNDMYMRVRIAYPASDSGRPELYRISFGFCGNIMDVPRAAAAFIVMHHIITRKKSKRKVPQICCSIVNIYHRTIGSKLFIIRFSIFNLKKIIKCIPLIIDTFNKNSRFAAQANLQNNTTVPTAHEQVLCRATKFDSPHSMFSREYARGCLSSASVDGTTSRGKCLCLGRSSARPDPTVASWSVRQDRGMSVCGVANGGASACLCI